MDEESCDKKCKDFNIQTLLNSGGNGAEVITTDECLKKKVDLSSIIENLRNQKNPRKFDASRGSASPNKYGETASASSEAVEVAPLQSTKPTRRRRMDRVPNTNGLVTTTDYVLHNNNNNNNNQVKNERLSPGTPDTSSRSRSVTPSSASHPDTPPAPENPLLSVPGRNYSDFMRSLAAKYNNSNPTDYFTAARNGFPPAIDPRFKPSGFPNLLSMHPTTPPKETDLGTAKKPDFSSILSPFANTAMFPPLIDMSTTQTLLAMVRTAKEAELQGLLKNVKRPESSSPLDLSAAGPPSKKMKMKRPTSNSPSGGIMVHKRADSESPNLHEDISTWSVDDVCNFVGSIDICAEYAQNFRDQRIDGAGLPLLTEEHLTTTINMKLGPALKLKSVLAKKIGSCNICLHCTHCHNNSTASPEPANTAGNSSDSGGPS